MTSPKNNLDSMCHAETFCFSRKLKWWHPADIRTWYLWSASEIYPMKSVLSVSTCHMEICWIMWKRTKCASKLLTLSTGVFKWQRFECLLWSFRNHIFWCIPFSSASKNQTLILEDEIESIIFYNFHLRACSIWTRKSFSSTVIWPPGMYLSSHLPTSG